jgi:hypothetical protein
MRTRQMHTVLSDKIAKKVLCKKHFDDASLISLALKFILSFGNNISGCLDMDTKR